MFTVPTIYFVNIDIKLKLPINVRRNFDSNKVRGEANSAIFIGRETLARLKDALICFTFLTTTRDFSEFQRCIIDNDYL